MKRFLTIILLLSLLMSAAVAEPMAQAETEPLRVLDPGGWRDYLKRYPDRQLESLEVIYDEQGRNNKLEILESGAWDMAVVQTDEIALTKLDEAGLLMDLATVPELAQRFENMFPGLLKAVTKGEKRLALPAGWLVSVTKKMKMTDVVKYKDGEVHVRKNLGFTAADEPTTFAQLSALAERYIALPKKVRKGTVFDVDSATTNAKNYFLYYLITIYTAQMVELDGQINYDTPLFRQGVEQLERMAEALKKDTKISYQQGGSGMRICGLICDNGAHFISDGKAIRMEESDTRIAARMEVIIINPNTSRLPEVLDYCRLLLENSDDEFVPLMYETYDRQALVQLMREKNLAIAQEIGRTEEITRAYAELERTDDSDYRYTEEELAEYRENTVPYLEFPLVPSMDTYAIAKEYVRGHLDVDGLIARLNEVAKGVYQ